MVPALAGSYEESPTNVTDMAIRDRRWCQGNLQHLRILPAAGLHWASRQHLATGIMAYLASPLWMAQICVGIILVFQASYIRPEYFTSEFTLFPAWPRFDAQRSLELFSFTMTILLLPKLFGLLLALLKGKTRRGSGGAIRLIISALFEVVLSALLAPIMMLIQTGHVMHFAFGFDTGWDPQRRDDGSIPLRAIARRHRSHVAMGLLMLTAGLMISPSLVAWMSPTIAGLVMAIFVSWASAQLSIGMFMRRLGLLVTPEEKEKPSVVQRANTLVRDFASNGDAPPDAIALIHSDPAFRQIHEAFLPLAARRKRGDIAPDWALAEAKLEDAESMAEASAWLTPRERMAVLQDQTLIAKLVRLP
jgi:membrane glycosyltransferase